MTVMEIEMDTLNIRLQIRADQFLGDGDIAKACALYEIAVQDAEQKGRDDTAKLLRERIAAISAN